MFSVLIPRDTDTLLVYALGGRTEKRLVCALGGGTDASFVFYLGGLLIQN